MSGSANERVNLTDRKIAAARGRGKPYELRDAQTVGLRVRVMPSGAKSFVVVRRWPRHPEDATRLTIGSYPVISLADARQKATAWLRLAERGIDPRDEDARLHRERQRIRANTFRAVAEEFIKRHISKTRKADVVARELRDEFIGPRPWRDGIEPWGDRPITEITQADVKAVLRAAVDRGAPYQAHNLLVHIRSLFNWAIAQDDYGLTSSPCDRLKPKAVIGEKKYRQRVLDDDELRAFWRATARMAYPFGTMFRMLLLTGQRKSEVSDARWKEFALDAKLWTVPPERFKSDATHLVPLSDDVLALLSELPRFQSGDHLFSTTFGKKPIDGFSKAKARLDRFMLEELCAIRGDKAELAPFVTHDLRRTVRTRLSALRVSDAIAEMVIGHGRKGLQRVYDQHKFTDEMREALELWAARLRSIVEPPPDNVIPMDRGAA